MFRDLDPSNGMGAECAVGSRGIRLIPSHVGMHPYGITRCPCDENCGFNDDYAYAYAYAYACDTCRFESLGSARHNRLPNTGYQ